MPRMLWFAVLLATSQLCANQLHAQQQLSIPTEEGSFKAGDPYNIDGVLARASTQEWMATVRYSSKTDNPSMPESVFICRGTIGSSLQKFQLTCNPDRQVPGGVYRTDGKISLYRSETNDRQTLSVRAPILTIIANPFAGSDIPQVVSLVLSFNQRQALENGSIDAQNLLVSFSQHYPREPKDTSQNRAYLRGQAEQARTIVDYTRRRFMGDSPTDPAPIFFQDFDRQLGKIIRDLGGVPAPHAVGSISNRPRFILAQMPVTRDSADAKIERDTQNKNVEALAKIIKSIADGFEKIGSSGEKQFTFSIETTPVDAELYIQRMDEPETKWGVTPLKDQKLAYALWTFRIDWGGCSSIEKPNPYLQAVISIKLPKTGCHTK